MIDVHEHVRDEKQARRLLRAMDEYEISMTCLLSASTFTFTLNRKYGFEGYKRNNEQLLEIKRQHPGRFCVFVAVDPLALGNLKLLRDYVRRGADGLKLYLGSHDRWWSRDEAVASSTSRLPPGRASAALRARPLQPARAR